MARRAALNKPKQLVMDEMRRLPVNDPRIQARINCLACAVVLG